MHLQSVAYVIFFVTHVLCIYRDRVRFVLTSDMAYVINDGDRQSDKFQSFIDMCIEAFNILRKHANLFINLFSLVGGTP